MGWKEVLGFKQREDEALTGELMQCDEVAPLMLVGMEVPHLRQTGDPRIDDTAKIAEESIGTLDVLASGHEALERSIPPVEQNLALFPQDAAIALGGLEGLLGTAQKNLLEASRNMNMLKDQAKAHESNLQKYLVRAQELFELNQLVVLSTGLNVKEYLEYRIQQTAVLGNQEDFLHREDRISETVNAMRSLEAAQSMNVDLAKKRLASHMEAATEFNRQLEESPLRRTPSEQAQRGEPERSEEELNTAATLAAYYAEKGTTTYSVGDEIRSREIQGAIKRAVVDLQQKEAELEQIRAGMKSPVENARQLYDSRKALDKTMTELVDKVIGVRRTEAEKIQFGDEYFSPALENFKAEGEALRAESHAIQADWDAQTKYVKDLVKNSVPMLGARLKPELGQGDHMDFVTARMRSLTGFEDGKLGIELSDRALELTIAGINGMLYDDQDVALTAERRDAVAGGRNLSIEYAPNK